MTGIFTRRQVVALGGVAGVSLLLSGCGAGATRVGLYVSSIDGAPRWIDDTTGAPAWSPDGAMLAWGDERGLRFWTRSQSDISRVSRIPVVGRPTWSPDNSAVAFLDSQSRVLQRIEIATGVTTPLATISDGFDGAIRTPIVTRGGPAWSPDGTRIAFICWDEFGDELCVVDPDGVSKEQVTTLGTEEEKTGSLARSSVTSMAWSPDGSGLIVAVQAEQRGATSGIFRVELDARSGRRLTRMTANAPLVWDEATSSVLFSSRVEDRSDVYRMPADGGAPESLSSGLADGAREPASDGRGNLAMVSGVQIALLRPGTSDVAYVQEPDLACVAPALGADGADLAYLALPRPIENYP